MDIEKDKNILLFNKKSDFRMEYCTLEEMEHKLTKKRKAESKVVFLAIFSPNVLLVTAVSFIL